MERIAGESIVLRATAYRDADRIVRLYGPDTGKVDALARGARKSQRRFAGLGIAVTGVAQIRERRTRDAFDLDSFEVMEPRQGLVSDVVKMAHASYALELVDRLTPEHHPDPVLFTWLQTALAEIDAKPANATRLRIFELGLLDRVGLGPAIDRCSSCGTALGKGHEAAWDANAGGASCSDCARGSHTVSDAFRDALTALNRCPLEAAETLNFPVEINRQCRNALQELLLLHTGGPLKTVEFIAKLSRA